MESKKDGNLTTLVAHGSPRELYLRPRAGLTILLVAGGKLGPIRTAKK